MMVEYDKVFPEYGFASNKGYGSADHIAALKNMVQVRFTERPFIKNFIGTVAKGYGPYEYVLHL